MKAAKIHQTASSRTDLVTLAILATYVDGERVTVGEIVRLASAVPDLQTVVLSTSIASNRTVILAAKQGKYGDNVLLKLTRPNGFVQLNQLYPVLHESGVTHDN